MNRDPSRALATTAGAVIIALTAAAFWLSYAHLAEVALAHGLHDAEVRAWAWPACLDLFIIAGEVMWLRAALAHHVDPWAIVLTVVGSGGSIALNVAGVGADAQALDYVVAAVPPTAALLAFGALMRQVHQALAGPAAAVTELQPERSSAPAELPEPAPELRAEQAEPITVERVPEPVDAQPSGPVLGPWTPVAELVGGTGGTAFDLRLPNGYRAAEPLGGTVPEPAPEPVPPTGTDTGTGADDIEATDSQNTTFEARVALVRTWLLTEPDLTGTEIGTKFRVSDGYGRRLLRTARGDT
ncbi:DUF2637 domain-containing protein [Streptomyces sp. SID12488]|uniref:DUF2637 domain-containing protein n=1 Tax=Streptomyces sp. SID12488 TaxID=2706040 RepID=UPI0013D92D5F|nr:DUF2637 domain-containing protein [Streptomyces sp. SID12488]